MPGINYSGDNPKTLSAVQIAEEAVSRACTSGVLTPGYDPVYVAISPEKIAREVVMALARADYITRLP
jgi:hypothetical protein